MIRDLSHIFARIFGVPLLIQPGKLEALLAGLDAARFHRGSLLITAEDGASLEPAQPEAPTYGYRLNKGVATVPVHGVLVRRAGQIDADSTRLQSYENLTRVLRNVRADRRARAILLDIDSPGGEAGGVFDFANEVRAIGRDKPVWAVANDDALSAAYAIAAAAQRVWVTDTGAAGGVGVVALHLDQSRRDEEAGIAYSYIFKGAHKIDANPHEPLSIEARIGIQGEIDRIYDKFTASVAEHRRLQPAQVRATEARVYFGGNARSEGLADEVGNYDQAHQALAESVSLGPVNSASRPRGDSRMDNSEDNPATTAATNVVNLDDVRGEARTQALAYAEEVSHLCKLGRHPELTGDFLKRNAPISTVARELMELNAHNDQARQIDIIDTAATIRAAQLGNQPSDVIKANAERMAAYQTPVRGSY
jgi:signal peptide peptidase SppA